MSPLDASQCLVTGLNQNYLSRSGTLYHIQVEDRGPVLDPVSEREVRRVNVIVYANYGEPNARIVLGANHDFDDLRTAEHNRFVGEQVQALALDARARIEERESREVERIKALLREYHLTKSERAKHEFAEANASFPFLFSRAWRELKEEHAGPAPRPAAPASTGGRYPLDPDLREAVLEIERVVAELERDLAALKQRGGADDILIQACRKLVARARESAGSASRAEFGARRLDMTRASLLTTLRQVRSRLKWTG